MGNRIHPTAVIDSRAELGDAIVVGAYAVIGADVVVGDGCEIGAAAQVEGPTVLGPENRVSPMAAIGFAPQDLKFEGERTRLEVGARNVFREFCTMQRGTGKGGGVTTIGDENLFMVYTHVAHDCHVGSRTVFSNGGTLAGHVEVGDDAVIGAYSAVHQFCRVGRHSYIGGYSVITRDPLPFVKTVGQKPAAYGVNTIGLERKGMDPATIKVLEQAMRLLLRSKLNTTQALERIEGELGDHEEIRYLVEFVRSSTRGVITKSPGRARSRGG